MPYPYALESFATHESRYMGVKPTTENGIPAIAIKAVNEAHPGIFRMVKKRCLNRCEFPESWNLPFPLVLLPKKREATWRGDPSAFRPNCLLDTTSKLLERAILSRFTAHTERPNVS